GALSTHAEFQRLIVVGHFTPGVSTMTRFILIVLSSALIVGGCVSSTSGNVYPRNQTRQAWTVEEGKVSEVKEVKIEGQQTYLGHVGGGYIGYEVGRYVGNGRGRDVAGAVGSVAGAVA